MITPRIETANAKKLIGMSLRMSFAQLRVGELFKSFMPRRKEIPTPMSADVFSMVIYSPNHFSNFHPSNEFTRWAALEVPDNSSVPVGMECFELPGGLYAVFDYKGRSTDPRIFEFIFGFWLPASGYTLDDRPHFELLGEKYRNDDPASEEQIWIPIKQ